MSSAILYQNGSKTVTLLDLPRSIEHGQGSTASLKSSPVLLKPHSGTEPQGRKREMLERRIPEDERKYHRDIRESIELALKRVRRTSRVWCFPRTEQFATPFSESVDLGVYETSSKLDSNIPPLLLSPLGNVVSDLTSLGDSIVRNPGPSTILAVGNDVYVIPPQSTFLSSTISSGTPAFWRAVQQSGIRQGQASALHRFNFILLDPPWANRSVRRSKTYKTTEDQDEDPFDQVLHILHKSIAADGYVGIWITNKATIRQRVLSSLIDIGFELAEEWTWIKITGEGQPVTELDGIWRKPYEILLLFSRSKKPIPAISRRILVAVPDLHSRKPCLKELIEPFLPQQYQALELFARSLTEGWWSWGCEVLKFQHDSQWASSKGEDVV